MELMNSIRLSFTQNQIEDNSNDDLSDDLSVGALRFISSARSLYKENICFHLMADCIKIA